MSNNIENLKIKEKSLKINNITRKEKACVAYLPNNNKIVIDKDTSLTGSIYHEFLHIALTTKNKNCINSGFRLDVTNCKFREKLNEGYTDIMEIDILVVLFHMKSK